MVRNPLCVTFIGLHGITFDIPKNISLYCVAIILKRAGTLAVFIKESLIGNHSYFSSTIANQNPNI